jgi:hypothetical protein
MEGGFMLHFIVCISALYANKLPAARAGIFFIKAALTEIAIHKLTNYKTRGRQGAGKKAGNI